LVSRSVSANVSGHNVEGLSLVKVAVASISRHDNNIDPWRGSPVGIVISLFSTFVTESISIVVLSGVDRSSSSKVSVINPETHVSLSSFAGQVVGIGLVHSIEGLSISSVLESSSGISGDGVGGLSVSQQDGLRIIRVGAHVLQDNIANQFSISTTSMLVGPLHREVRTLIKAHGGSIAISSLCIILRIV
jgi:hypothetical protein